MLITYSTRIMQQIHHRFQTLYGDRADACIERLSMMVGRYGVGTSLQGKTSRWDQSTAVLITYGDMVTRSGERPLQTLKTCLDAHVEGLLDTVHILPFTPYSSDDGFSVIDYRAVDPALGRWSDIEDIAGSYHLMADLVLNHVSSKSQMFRSYITGVAPERDYFIEADPESDLSSVVRPRSSPLLTAVDTRRGRRHVWTTFSDDQVDLNFANPDVLFEFLDIIFWYVAHGMQVMRLDAIAYLWKTPGTSCIHLPETHEVVKLLRDVLDMVAPHVVLLTETNVPHEENLSYFGRGDEAHMVYQFSLPPLLLHGLLTGQAGPLADWAGTQPPLPHGCTTLNFTASHDGIGVRPLEGLVEDAEVARLAEHIGGVHGRISMRRMPSGEERPYELNTTYFDALGEPGAPHPTARHIARFLCSQAVMLALKGVPGVYFNSLFASRNDRAGARRTGRARTLNRRKWEMDDLEARLTDKQSHIRKVYTAYRHLLQTRRKHPAFHPDGFQKIIHPAPSVLAIERTAPAGDQVILTLHNLGAEPVEFGVQGTAHGLSGKVPCLDLLSGTHKGGVEGRFQLRPYEVCWLTLSRVAD